MTTFEILTLFALFLGASWPFWQLYRLFRGANLRVRLTTEVFFRLSTGFGEAVFVKPVLLAENGNVLVEGVSGTLTRTTTESTKQWEVEFKRFGEVVRNPNDVVSNHHFYSSSPLQFLVENVPLRAVYMGVLRGYSEEFMELVSELSKETVRVKDHFPAHLTAQPSLSTFQQFSKEDQARFTESLMEMTKLSEQYASKLVDKIQLEKGTYELYLTVGYRALGGPFTQSKVASSRIKFSVGDGARDRIRAAFPTALLTEMTNVVFGRTLPIVNPEYTPTDTHEL